MNKAISISIFCLTFALNSNAMEKTLFKSWVPKTHHAQLTKYILLQAKKSEEERAIKQERSRQARQAQAAHDQGKVTQQEYIARESQAYMIALQKFIKQSKEGNSNNIPLILQPHTVVYVPHRNGLLEFRLDNCSSISRARFQQVILDFFQRKIQKTSKRCKNIRHDIYTQESLVLIKKLMKAEFELFVEEHNKPSKTLSAYLEGIGAKVTLANGSFLVKVPVFLDGEKSKLAIGATLMLQNAQPPLSNEEVQQGLDMIDSASFIAIKGQRFLTVSNFQGVVL